MYAVARTYRLAVRKLNQTFLHERAKAEAILLCYITNI